MLIDIVDMEFDLWPAVTVVPRSTRLSLRTMMGIHNKSGLACSMWLDRNTTGLGSSKPRHDDIAADPSGSLLYVAVSGKADATARTM